MRDLVGSSVSGAGSHTAEAQNTSHTAAGAQQLSDDGPVLLFEGQHPPEKKEHEGKIYHYMLCNFVLNKCHHI